MENSLKRFIQIKNLQKWQVEAIEVKQGTPKLVEVDWDKSLLPKLVNPID